MKDNQVYLKHILDAILKIELYIKDADYNNFLTNSMIQDAVIRQIEIIGEAVKNLSFDLKDKYPYIQWKDIAGMRDKLIHDYFGVDIDAVWDTAIGDIPGFKKQIEDILK